MGATDITPVSSSLEQLLIDSFNSSAPDIPLVRYNELDNEHGEYCDNHNPRGYLPNKDTVVIVQCTRNGNQEQQPFAPVKYQYDYDMYNTDIILNNGHGGITDILFSPQECDEDHEKKLIATGPIRSFYMSAYDHICSGKNTTTTEIVASFAQAPGSRLLLNESLSINMIWNGRG